MVRQTSGNEICTDLQAVVVVMEHQVGGSFKPASNICFHLFPPGVYDLLHQAAFRDTLGRSLYAPEYMIGKYSPEQLLHFMKTYISTNRIALVGVGVDHDELLTRAKSLTPFAAAEIANDKAKYHGGTFFIQNAEDWSVI